MNVSAQKFQSLYALVCKSSAWSNQRTTLPQSRIRSTAPSEREPGTPHPGSLSEGAGSPQGLTEGVSFVEWYKPKSFELRRGDENRPYPSGLASTRLNGNVPRLPL